MPYTFLPGVDLLNHGGVHANCELTAVKNVDGTWGDVEVVCTKDVPAGNQLTISYGDESDNCRLLRLYGFANRGNVNDRREVELRITGDALEAWRASRQWGPGIDAARRAVLRRHGLPRLTSEFEHADVPDELDTVDGSNPGDGSNSNEKRAVFRDPTLPRGRGAAEPAAVVGLGAQENSMLENPEMLPFRDDFAKWWNSTRPP